MAGFDLSRLNAGQRAVVERLDEPLFVAAGAGSGKTFTLTARLVHALSEGSAPDGGRYLRSIDEALVITFTDAAALEIKERVRDALRRAGEDDLVLREESLKVDEAWISTIHGMCSRILRRHAIELGVDPKFKVCEGSVADALMARALDEVMRDVQRDDAYAALRAEYPVWSAAQGAFSVVGMVRALMTEAHKFERGFDAFVCPQSEETEAAMVRLRAAIEALCGLKMTGIQRGKAEGSLASVVAFCELPPGQRTPERACEALAGIGFPSLRKAEHRLIKGDADRALAEAEVCAQFERVQGFAPQLVGLARRVNERYAELKRASSYLDNDDLIDLALKAVGGSHEVRRDYEGRFRLVMIDEFQDTDQKQLSLISMLSGEEACHLVTVGDAQQSIYRFRGGDVEVFRARGRELPTTAHVAMDVNYRSDPAVLALVERTCGDAGLLGDFLKLAADGGHRSSLTARNADGSEPPRIRVEVCSGGKSDVISATIASQLADRLASYRDAGQSQGSMALLLGTTSKVGLYLDALRARGLQAVVTGGSSFSSTPEVGVIQALLHTLANPHDTETGLFRLLSSDMFRLDADDFCQLGTRTQELLDAPTKRAIEQCFVEGELSLFGDAEPSPRLRLAHEVLLRAFSRVGKWQLADVCQAVVEESGWLVRLERQGLNGLSVAANVLAAVRYVRDLTTELGLGAARAAEEFDRWLEAAKLTPANLVGDAVDAVKVMTVHGSKGLQFAVTAVAECWSRPEVKGRLSLGRVNDSCVVCAKPAAAIKEFSKKRAAVGCPDELVRCKTVGEYSWWLDQHEVAAEGGEKARLLYVALTRAEEVLVVGVPVPEERYRSDLAMGFLGAFPELDGLEAGEWQLDFSPELPIECEQRVPDGTGGIALERTPAVVGPGVARVITLERQGKAGDSPCLATSAGSLAGFDDQLPQSVTAIPLLGTGLEGQTQQKEPFTIYATQAPELQTFGWRAREGVFSYSSAHALMEQRKRHADGSREAVAPSGGAGSQPGPASAVGGNAGNAPATPERPASRPPAPPKAEQQAEAEGSAYTDDADKATNLGSAFHELAQTMVETGRSHDPARLEALSRQWHLSSRQRARLEEAIARWERSALRREALGYDLLRPEVPFFIHVGSVYGEYVEGAIDLLCCDHDSDECLVIDYKTGDVGLTLEQVRARHEMQANFYAYVMMSQGYERVTCAFVCVECDAGDGQPIDVRYVFDACNPPRI